MSQLGYYATGSLDATASSCTRCTWNLKPPELKTGLGMAQLPWGDSGAPVVLFRMGLLAYNLFIGMTRLACPAAWASQTSTTVRWTQGQVAGRCLRHAGPVIMRLVRETAARACWHSIRQRGGARGAAT